MKSRNGKFNNTKVTIDEHRFDSKKESQVYLFYKSELQAKRIASIELQPKYILLEGYIDIDGSKVRPIHYIADFRITYPDGRVVVVDVKGKKTEVYKLKKKLLLSRYPDMVFQEW